MKRWTGVIAILAFFAAGVATSQTKSTTKEKDAQGTMHMESTAKHTGPGPNTKTKTETVIGTVKTYEAGKKITVTGPKDKDYSFDLDENVATKGTFNVGDRVKVVYSKTDGGEKVTTISNAPTASHAKKTKKTAA
jgi:hypothetical protein